MAYFFNSFNGISVFHDKFWVSNADLSLYTDSAASSGKAFGAYFQGKWAYGLWPEEWCQLGITKYITELELFKFFMAIEIYITELELFKIFVAIEI